MATPVTRETSSCASSTISTSWLGRTGAPSMASMASSAWLVTTTSASLARSRAASAKHSAPYAHLRGAQALPGGDRDLRPGPVGDARGEVVPVAGLGLVGPVPQPQQVLAELAGGGGRLERVEEPVLLFLRHAFVEAVQAQVVRPALEHGELGAAAQQRVQRVDRARQVALDELALEGEGGRGDHDPLAVRQRGHQIAERLAGAGAGLDEQMGAVVDRPRRRLRPWSTWPGRSVPPTAVTAACRSSVREGFVIVRPPYGAPLTLRLTATGSFRP